MAHIIGTANNDVLNGTPDDDLDRKGWRATTRSTAWVATTAWRATKAHFKRGAMTPSTEGRAMTGLGEGVVMTPCTAETVTILSRAATAVTLRA